MYSMWTADSLRRDSCSTQKTSPLARSPGQPRLHFTQATRNETTPWGALAAHVARGAYLPRPPVHLGPRPHHAKGAESVTEPVGMDRSRVHPGLWRL